MHRFPNLLWRIWRGAKYLVDSFVISPPHPNFLVFGKSLRFEGRLIKYLQPALSNTKLKLYWRAIQVRGRGGLYGRVGGSRPGPGEQNGVARGPVGGRGRGRTGGWRGGTRTCLCPPLNTHRLKPGDRGQG